MIVQFFPRINVVKGLAYSVNTTGALEIIPKPTGMGVFTRPTILSTHAVKDEFLTGDDEKYDTNGLRRMLTDQGFECVMVEHSLHGRYIQVGKQTRDGYTRYLENYQNPTEWEQPRPWSCRIKKDILQVVELCIPMPKETHTCFVGKVGETDLRVDVEFSPWIKFQNVTVKDVIPVATEKHRRYPAGSLDLSSSNPDLQSQSFSRKLAIVMEPSKPSQDYANSWKTLADELVDASIDDSKTLIPAPTSLNGRYPGMVYCLPFPDGVEYVGVKRDAEGKVVDWEKFEIGAFEQYDGEVRLTDGGKTSTFPILTNDITAFKEWKDDTTKWVPGVEHYRTCRTECLFEWPVVVYTPSGGGSVEEDDKPLLTQKQFRNSRPVCFVPLMVRFVPADGYHGPIDHKSGRRLCMGSAIFAFICSTDPSQYYTPETTLSLSMVQMRWPITATPIFDDEYGLARSATVPDVEVKREVIDANEKLRENFIAAYDRLNAAMNNYNARTTLGELMDINFLRKDILDAVEVMVAEQEAFDAAARLAAEAKDREDERRVDAELESFAQRFYDDTNFTTTIGTLVIDVTSWFSKTASIVNKACRIIEVSPGGSAKSLRALDHTDLQYVLPLALSYNEDRIWNSIFTEFDTQLQQDIMANTPDVFIFRAVHRVDKSSSYRYLLVNMFDAMTLDTRDKICKRLKYVSYNAYYKEVLAKLSPPSEPHGA